MFYRVLIPSVLAAVLLSVSLSNNAAWWGALTAFTHQEQAQAPGGSLSGPPVVEDAQATPTVSPQSAPDASADVDTDKKVLDLLARAGEHGLNPKKYVPIEGDIRTAVTQYIHDMTGMRVNAKSIGLRPGDWRAPLSLDQAWEAYTAAPDKVAYLESLAPATPLYTALQKELKNLTPMIGAGRGGDAFFPIKTSSRLIRPGDTDASIPDLRTRLGAMLPPGGDPQKYDDVLARVVMDFQSNHGLKQDGIIGPDTIAFFNQTYFDRYVQVIANLERLRWLDPVKPSRYIVVNIPAARLWAIDEGKVAMEMPVVVGRPKRATPQFRTMITGVRFNPTWTVPYIIKQEDYLPVLRDDPVALMAKGIDVFYKQDDDTYALVDPRDVDWHDVTDKDLYNYRMVQKPGKGNALGRVRVIMPNEFGIYLHDTNTPDTFRSDERSISSGCIRLSRPFDMAAFIMRGMDGWDSKKIADVVRADKTRDQLIKTPFPVILLYQTAWTKNGQELVLSYDIYQEDIKLYKALAKADHVPVFSK